MTKHLPLLLFLLPQFAISQTAFTGDKFGGRLWYHPTNYSVGSYSGHTVCGVTNQLYSWGGNSHRELGDGSVIHRKLPVMVDGMSDVYYYSAGYVAGAIKRDGSGWVWGGGFQTPTNVIDDVKYLDAGSHAVVFIKSDGSVWSVGYSRGGSFGNKSFIDKSTRTPVKMAGINNAVRVANGWYSTLVLLENGDVMISGLAYGLTHLGIPSTNHEPIKIPGLKHIIAIACAKEGFIALDVHGNVYQWGKNAIHGHLSTVSLRKVSQLSNIVAISARNDGGHFLALDSAHRVYAWGINYKGSLGTGKSRHEFYPVKVADNAIDILAGESFSYIVKSDFTLWATGTNHGGSIYLSDITTKSYQFIPVDITPNLGICQPRYADFDNYSADTIYFCYGDSVDFQDSVYTSTAEIISVFQNRFGFDSLSVINLIELPSPTDTIRRTLCAGDTIYHRGKKRWLPGFVLDTMDVSMPCNLIQVSELITADTFYHPSIIYLCEDELFHLGNQVINKPTEITLFFKSEFQCDSIVQLSIRKSYADSSSLDTSICKGDTLWIENYGHTLAGNFIDTIATSHGCDSIIKTQLTTIPVYRYNEKYEVCSNEDLTLHGKIIEDEGLFHIPFVSSLGCDSSYSIQVVHLPVKFLENERSICDGDSIKNGDVYYSNSAVFSDTLTSNLGCDSIVTTNLNVYPKFEFYEEIQKCSTDTIEQYGKLIPKEGTYRYNYTSTHGCDSTIYLTVLDKKSLECHHQCYIPSAFTPNGDGRNDNFGVYTNRSEAVVMKIYNRWGECVFSGSGLNPTWDGTSSGKLCPPGIYVYMINSYDKYEKEVRYRGSLSLLR